MLRDGTRKDLLLLLNLWAYQPVLSPPTRYSMCCSNSMGCCTNTPERQLYSVSNEHWTHGTNVPEVKMLLVITDTGANIDKAIKLFQNRWELSESESDSDDKELDSHTFLIKVNLS
jgi:hypothetical protein